MSFPRYPKYKPSGVEWLGDVPEGWEVRRLKSIVQEPLKYGANEAAELDDRTLPRFVRITDIDEAGGLRDETFKSLPAEVAEPFLLCEGDVLLARSGATVGKSFIYSTQWGPACFAGYLIRARLSHETCLARWLYYFCQTSGYWGYVVGSQIQATIQNVSAEKYANLYLTIPPLPEQTAIAEFLDRETGKIDGLVAEQRRLMELLKEKRQAVISHAVTKGLNPHAPMKPSGIEWLGDVPAGWGVKKLGRAAFMQEGPGLRNWQFTTDGTRVICVTNITEAGIDFARLEKFISIEEYKEIYLRFTVRKGDVLLSSSGNSWGKVAIYEGDEEVILNTSTIRLNQTATAPLDRSYIALLLQSDTVREQLRLAMTGSCQPNFGPTHLNSVMVSVPSNREQLEIIASVQSATTQLDTLTAEAQRAIDLLQERRTALISAAVTGQIDVRPHPKN